MNAPLLIVEDDQDVAEAARLALSDLGHPIRLASNPVELAERLSEGRFEAVLLDMNFRTGARSGEEGLDALTTVHASDPELSVVLMTAYGAVSLAVQALKRGATDFVLKPWSNDALVRTVRSAVDATRSRRTAAAATLEQLEREAVVRALRQAEGNVSRAAAALGLTRPALYRRMEKHGL